LGGKKKEEARGTVRSRWDWLSGFTTPRDGWAIPREGRADAELPGGLLVHIEIEVEEGHARARSVTVSTENPHGVGWRALSQIPARDIVATAILDGLMKAGPGDEGAVQLLPPGRADADQLREVVQAAVGYRPRVEGFRVIAGGEQ
jgi:hypothetical protein